jgi:hypothetical protein
VHSSFLIAFKVTGLYPVCSFSLPWTQAHQLGRDLPDFSPQIGTKAIIVRAEGQSISPQTANGYPVTFHNIVRQHERTRHMVMRFTGWPMEMKRFERNICGSIPGLGTNYLDIITAPFHAQIK